MSLPPCMNDGLESRSANLSGSTRERGEDEEPWRGELVRRADDKRTRQLRGSAKGARDGRRRVLYLIFATHEMHSAPHVSCSALGELRRRLLPLRRIALRGIDFRSARAFARYETPIITEDSRNNDGGRGRLIIVIRLRWIDAKIAPAVQEVTDCLKCGRSDCCNFCSAVFFVPKV